MSESKSNLKARVKSLLGDPEVASGLESVPDKAAAIKLLLDAAKRHKISLRHEELDGLIGEHAPEGKSKHDVSREDLASVAGRALMARCTRTYVGHTDSCAHCIKTCL